MYSFNVDQVVKHVKTLADNNRCIRCDQLNGLRVRYSCGHYVCDDCVLTTEDCSLCLSPSDVPTLVNDGPQNLRVEHASNLLNTFQDLFKLDVYRRQRLSEQLLLEKELFPECIQAPSKYSNSRKSCNISIKNKENLKPTTFPGEITSRSSILKMENKISYVQQWLNKTETSPSETNLNLPRKPFTDLNVNGQNVMRPKTPNKVAKRKKTPSRSKTHLNSFGTGVKNKSRLILIRKKEDGSKLCKSFENCKQKQCDKNESGIVEDMEIVDDAPSVDKDRNAWLAVLEAEKYNICNDNITVPDVNKKEVIKMGNKIDKPAQHINIEATGKVPFYKRSSLLTINYLNHQYKENVHENQNIKKTSNSNNVTIKIDNRGFATTITLYEEQDVCKSKHSIGVQTEDENEPNTVKCTKVIDSNENINALAERVQIPISVDFDTEHPNLYKDTAPIETHPKRAEGVKEQKVLIIDDSDSDSDNLFSEMDSLLEVTAEVHRSEIENDSSVLLQLEQGEYENRMRHAVWDHTPASSDSSDKENYDPNRAKRLKLDKKCHSKKY